MTAVAALLEAAKAASNSNNSTSHPSDEDADETDIGSSSSISSSTTTHLSLSNQNLTNGDFPDTLELPLHLASTLLSLDLSRNHLCDLPLLICQLTALQHLDVSRNSLRSLPSEISNLIHLRELLCVSNNFRIRLLPLEALASLSRLQVLDVRFNSKLKLAAKTTLEQALGANVQVQSTIPDNDTTKADTSQKLSACDRDPNDLQAQLEPLSTPQLRKRLERTFHVHLDDDQPLAFDRDYIMKRLLESYHAHGPRTIRQERGIPVAPELLEQAWKELEAINWPHTTRERPKVKAQHYMILQKPGSGQVDSKRTRKETAKWQKYQAIYDVAVQVLEATLQEIDPEFPQRFTALAVTKNFQGSPHIDTLNVGPFYGLALGHFELGGGKIAVECSPTVVAEIDTRGRLAKVDGRFPHWVTPYKVQEDATRYSLIYYVTSGQVLPQTTAIFEPPRIARNDNDDDDPWIPPPSFVK